MPQPVLPDLIIAGAPKSGSTSLFHWLADHPGVVGSLEKETYFLVDPGTHMHLPDRHVSHGLDGYEALFPKGANDGRLRVEATPSYMVHETAREAARDMPSKPLILFILRDPIAQVRSSFEYFRNNWSWIPPQMSFEDWVAGSHDRAVFRENELAADPIGTASYVRHLRLWRDAVGPDRIITCLFEDMIADRTKFMKSLADRLELTPNFYDTYDFPLENETYTVRNRALQRLNIAVRGRLPKGAAYDAARAVYRAVNTKRKAKGARPELDPRLHDILEAENAALAREFDLDLSAWTVREHAH